MWFCGFWKNVCDRVRVSYGKQMDRKHRKQEKRVKKTRIIRFYALPPSPLVLGVTRLSSPPPSQLNDKMGGGVRMGMECVCRGAFA